MSTTSETVYVQVVWEDTTTGEIQQPLLAAPVAIGREQDQMPEQLGDKTVSRLELLNKEVSRFHALITVANSQLYITDRSANGTFLNGRQIRSGSQPFSSKDTIRIGPYKIVVMLMGEGDPNATALNRDRTVAEQLPALHKNTMVIWLIGAVVLVLMGLVAWGLVGTLLERSRPQVPDTPAPVNSTR